MHGGGAPVAPNENALVASLSIRHGVSEDAVRTVLNALRSGNGTMAQFTHPEFGGMAQWSTGMTMVGDMFNDKVKARLNAIATDLASYLRENPMAGEGEAQVSYRSRSRPFQSWWPVSFGVPSASGAQNDLRYAIFADTRRLVIEDAGKLVIYDTGEHRISGISQAQSSEATLTFVSQQGLVRVSDLSILDHW
jgi:hypothetical protein